MSLPREHGGRRRTIKAGVVFALLFVLPVLGLVIQRSGETSPLLGTFFYPWYGNSGRWAHWQNGGHNPPSTWASNFLPSTQPTVYDPSTELYDSSNTSVVLWQLAGMKRAGIQFAISSWWGQGTPTDTGFRNIILNVMKNPDNPYPSLRWTIYYESEGYSDPPETQIKADLSYVISNYGQSPNFLRIDGRYVIFVYGDANDTSDYVKKWSNVRSALGDVYIVLKVFPGYQAYAAMADGWHQYAPANRFQRFGSYSAFVSPGFWKYGQDPVLARNLTQFEAAVQRLKATNATFLLVETWNEYHEGTMIEPAQEIIYNSPGSPFKPAGPSYGYEFVDILGKYFGVPASAAGIFD